MKKFKNIFRRKEKPAPQPLRIEGVGEAPLTAEPDDAELAAAALLEHMLQVSSSKFQVSSKEGGSQPETRNLKPETGGNAAMKPETRDAKYFKDLAARIRTAQEAARLRTLRFLAFVEQELAKKELPVSGAGSLGLLEAELLKRIDVIERHGGELKTRWQHCVAQVMVRLYNVNDNGNDNDNDNGNDNG